MKDVIPKEFIIEYVFFGFGGKNTIKLNDKLIFVHEGEWKDPFKLITIEIDAQKDDWVEFWKTMDEIRVWNWKSSYKTEDENFHVDGDIWHI